MGVWMKRASLVMLPLLMLPFGVLGQNYTLDPQHSYVEWHIDHFGFSTPSGKWMANGKLVYDEKNLQNSKVEAKINVADIVTAIPELDKHLKSKLFFDVAEFPTATFVSNKVEVKDNQINKVLGNLTLRGVIKPVVLDVKFNKKGPSPISDKETVGFSAKTTLKRSDFGINTLLPGLSDNVELNIEVEAN
ncbi:MAG: polyisoprenoid-binding protein [Proteobacteria bacterium]|nr:polyisoprenoid-binding protein [Pseudomonadota bacterium]